jgi:imidazolonepropionase-like amidohydrolase
MIGLEMPVVLATDFNPGSSPTTAVPIVLLMASTQMRMTPAEAITTATVHAAYSFGQEIGSLEPDKLADFRDPQLQRLQRNPLFLRPRDGTHSVLRCRNCRSPMKM